MTEIEEFTCLPKTLSLEDKQRLQEQDSRLVTDFKASLLEKDARKHWDLFYKRNETRFFKDRHWTTREFTELLNNQSTTKRVLFEIGCGVGNFIFPLVEEKLDFYIIACDLSSKAIEIVRRNELYNEEYMRAFQVDITTEDILNRVDANSVDIATLIFVLSAIHPDKFVTTLKVIHKVLKPGGILLFRDYGLYDMAQLRFKAGHKISNNFYMRQDGTRSYYFSVEFFSNLCLKAGFEVISNSYVHRKTVNKKENIDVPRIFIQAKIKKPS
ncbi:tRNA N(3)-methylcytidine methyltransferase METTL6 [Tribolium madens]|uniref:tRNA N(3)-methylcytidine methyltransferase METTL6 n=1 Tax=Tribolium madens TaxID=41895 RepID=UPI001CF73A6B|nr:tRNA N(3)-methylcytidine methyltransferase METTL6 [Tribolium madens]